MLHRRILGMALAAMSFAAHADDCDFSAVTTRTQQLLQTTNLSDAGIMIGSARGVLFQHYFGSYDKSTVVPVASATKLLSGVRIMQLVDRGLIDLDTPVSTYLPEFTDVKGTMTMREMFSHTAGYGNDEDSLVLAADTTLAEDVTYIANHVDQPYPPPGSYFAYGGISMQVGGEVAQVQSGEDWQDGWIAHVGVPLGITTIDWQGLKPTQNYRISGSAQSSLPDYGRVLAMLVGGGVGNGRRILSTHAIATLDHDQTNGAALAYAPPTAQGSTAYGIGAWIEPVLSVSADAPTISSIGKFGFTPWVDFAYGYFGVLMVYQPNPTTPTIGQHTHAALEDVSAIVRAQLEASCPLQTTFDEIFRDGVDGFP
ncbi:MAG TPA: serine hydrolase [Rudaea sp.]|nr:serine hydrolase [Rudaea sp.]